MRIARYLDNKTNQTLQSSYDDDSTIHNDDENAKTTTPIPINLTKEENCLSPSLPPKKGNLINNTNDDDEVYSIPGSPMPLKKWESHECSTEDVEKNYENKDKDTDNSNGIMDDRELKPDTTLTTKKELLKEFKKGFDPDDENDFHVKNEGRIMILLIFY